MAQTASYFSSDDYKYPELGTLIEGSRWNTNNSPNPPKVKVSIPILFPDVSTQRSNGVSQQNYLTLSIPHYLYPEKDEFGYRTLPSGTSLIVVFIGGLADPNYVRIIGLG